MIKYIDQIHSRVEALPIGYRLVVYALAVLYMFWAAIAGVGLMAWGFGGESPTKRHEWRRILGALIWPFVINNNKFTKWMNEGK